MRTILVLLGCLSFLSEVVRAEDPFAAFVRTTEPLGAAAEQKTFHLPPGFQIELVASEPEIAKPMNLAFDSRGRLWVSVTREYPFPAKAGATKKDSIKVIELGEDGQAAKISTFAEGLDIPVGIYPITDGRRVLAYDINNVCRYTDGDGDGKSEQREVLYSGFGYERDTHGMASNFRRGFDGWVYGCHGFNNISDVKGRDGDVMHLQSGNTYRMRLDGTHIEAFTIGQINPFGMCLDPLGNIYTSDSHSKPIYQLLRGGRYEAFDRNTDEGLGLAPAMMSHLHGSTAIAGSQFYAADAFPEEFRGNVFTGNVVTCRINRDRLEYHGSTPKAIEMPDFLTCDDPWFRPVNTVLGPDGALYVADFYNRIIAHYEVKLDDPRRDYERGRIWRISYRSHGRKSVDFDISKANVQELIAKLNDPNLIVRMLATNELSDRIGADAVEPLDKLLHGRDISPWQKIHGSWALFRIQGEASDMTRRFSGDPSAAVRVHVMRMVAEQKNWTSEAREIALGGTQDPDGLVRRCAADALGQHPDVANVPWLIDMQVDPADTHLMYVERMALRNQLAPAGSFAKLKDVKLGGKEIAAIADVSLAIPSRESATFVLAHIDQLAQDKDHLTKYLRHAVRYGGEGDAEGLAKLMREKFADDVDLQLEMLGSMQKATAQRGEQLGGKAREWGVEVVKRVLGDREEASDWANRSVHAADSVMVNPWSFQHRRCSDGKDAVLLSTFPAGEQTTGILRSKAFSIPSRLSLYVAGHNGNPNMDSPVKNLVRLRSAGADEVLAESPAPRNDVAQKVEWDLHEHAGDQAYLEVVDGDDGNAFAWIAFARIEPPVVKLPKLSPREMQKRLASAAGVAGAMRIAESAEDMKKVLGEVWNDTDTRAAAAGALAAIGVEDAAALMARVIGDAGECLPLRDKVARSLGSIDSPAARDAIIAAFKLAPAELQTTLAMALTSGPGGGEALVQAVAEGKAPARVLLEPGMKERLAAGNVADLEARVKKLTQGMAPAKEELAKLIVARRVAFVSAKTSAEQGAAVFAKNCSACHQIDGRGGLVGPQLAGLSKRGVERVIEDVLDPNRNVDPAFRYSTIILKDGRLITGLQKKQDGQVVTFSDSTGKEVAVNAGEIKKRIESNASLMPGNFAEILQGKQFNNLVAYLLTK